MGQRKIKNKEIISELKRIQKENGGKLKPIDVVETAKDEDNILHPLFTWDDSEAAHQFRLWEARKLISVVVEITPYSKEMVNVFVSLTPTRKELNGGYDLMGSVLNDKKLRAILLRDAISEMEYFKQKYFRLTELAKVFDAMNKTLKKYKK